MDRRQFLTATAGIALSGLAAPAIAQAKTKIRVGYLHTVAVDGQIWTGIDRGNFDKQGLELEMRQFNTGLELFQALIGGSLDVLSTGAVLSNFPARGQGKVFLINDIEVATAQLWVRPEDTRNQRPDRRHGQGSQSGRHGDGSTMRACCTEAASSSTRRGSAKNRSCS